MVLESLLAELVDHRGHPDALQALQRLNDLAKSGEIRDFPWVVSEGLSLYKALFQTLAYSWNYALSEQITIEESLALSIWIRVYNLPEYDPVAAERSVKMDFLQQVLDRIMQLSSQSSEASPLSAGSVVRLLQHLLLSLYSASTNRAAVRNQLIKRLLSVRSRKDGHERMHVSALLQLLQPMLACMDDESKQEIVSKVLLPLHEPNEMILWRDQVPVLQSYHEDLVHCMITMLTPSPPPSAHMLPDMLTGVLAIWPDRFASNTPKQVLLLHEMEMLLERCTADDFKAVKEVFMKRFLSCISYESENILPTQRALSFFKNSTVLRLLTADPANVADIVYALYRHGKVSWNVTVNKMTALALKALLNEDQDMFAAAAAKALASYLPSSPTPAPCAPTAAPAAAQLLPPRARPRLAGAIAPAALPMAGYSKERPPPVTVTGVAPWAVMPPSSTTTMPPMAFMPPPSRVQSIQEQQRRAPSTPPVPVDPVSMLKGYMHTCYEYIFSSSPAVSKPWNSIQAAAAPELLSFKFHDLVYGKLLGEGAFGVVKYARQINRDLLQSSWSEYAVKVISSEKLIEHQYTALAMKEIAILRLLRHPNVARLISCFRYKESLYLVLEYASRGDLHSYLLSNSLEHTLLRFVLGEIVAVLVSLHEIGFVYNDLKPENILITELGHIKLADFGACRPLHEAARSMLVQSLEEVKTFRSGDWKEHADDSKYEETVSNLLAANIQTAAEDDRYEGTAAYMPPELFHAGQFVGNQQTTSVDSWALGCVLYFCLHGKPLFYGELDQLTEQWGTFANTAAGRVHFDVPDTVQDDLTARQQAAAETLLAQLLSLDPTARPTASQLLNHPYLTHGLQSAGTGDECPPVYNPISLHASIPPSWPESNKEQTASDGLWARRQFSSLWAPMPKDYQLQGAQFQAKGATGDEQVLTLLAMPLRVVEL